MTKAIEEVCRLGFNPTSKKLEYLMKNSKSCIDIKKK